MTVKDPTSAEPPEPTGPEQEPVRSKKPRFVIYEGMDRPGVEVLIGPEHGHDEQWTVGELRMWRHDSSGWAAQVQWRPPGDRSRKIDWFASTRVRPDASGTPAQQGSEAAPVEGQHPPDSPVDGVGSAQGVHVPDVVEDL